MVYEFVIVGAGLAGATTAYHLRARSLCSGTTPPRVLVVEKEPTAGQHSSGRNAALVRRHLDDPLLAPLAVKGADVLQRGELAPFHQTGSILVGLGDEHANRRFPLAQGRGLWCPEDGIIDVAALLAAYLKDQDVRYKTEVIDWTPPANQYRGRTGGATRRDDQYRDRKGADTQRNDQYRDRKGAAPGIDGPHIQHAPNEPLIVRTTTGQVTTRVLVNAAGPWAGTLGRLPLTPTNRHLFTTPPMPEIKPNWPFVWDIANGLYFRPESGGLLMCACDETPADPGMYNEDPRVADRLAELIRTHQPNLGDLRIMRSWVGQRTFAPDRRFVIGHDPRDKRIFHVAALGGHGVTTSPAVGAFAAEMLLNPAAATNNPFDPSRLSKEPTTYRAH